MPTTPRAGASSTSTTEAGCRSAVSRLARSSSSVLLRLLIAELRVNSKADIQPT
jgi:hypothetical protein